MESALISQLPEGATWVTGQSSAVVQQPEPPEPSSD